MQDLQQDSRNLEILMPVVRLQILDVLAATGTGTREKLQLLIGSDQLLPGPRMPFPATCLLPGFLGVPGVVLRVVLRVVLGISRLLSIRGCRR